MALFLDGELVESRFVQFFLVSEFCLIDGRLWATSALKPSFPARAQRKNGKIK